MVITPIDTAITCYVISTQTNTTTSIIYISTILLTYTMIMFSLIDIFKQSFTNIILVIYGVDSVDEIPQYIGTPRDANVLEL